MKIRFGSILVMTLTMILAGCATQSETIKPVHTTAAFKERMIAHGSTVVDGVTSDMTQTSLMTKPLVW